MTAMSIQMMVSSLLCHGPELAIVLAIMEAASNGSSQTIKARKVAGGR
jgi:hypothetical protein